MKVVICDQPAALARGTDYEVDRLKSSLPGCEVAVHPYSTQQALLDELRDADGCITAFLPMGEEVFSVCPKLKCISIDATAFNTIDLEAADSHGIKVCAVRNYCTTEVAEHVMTLVLAGWRKLKLHGYRLEKDYLWRYKEAAPIQRLEGSTIALFGFGRIGQCVAKRAAAFGLRLLAVDPYLPPEIAESLGATLVTADEAAREADIITVHISAMHGDKPFFDDEFFAKCARKPLFVNCARGLFVDEQALIRALDNGLLRGACLDVLTEEQPDPHGPLFGREDIIITPHAAFYSEQSLRALQDISCDNLAAILSGKPENANYIVNP